MYIKILLYHLYSFSFLFFSFIPHFTFCQNPEPKYVTAKLLKIWRIFCYF